MAEFIQNQKYQATECLWAPSRVDKNKNTPGSIKETVKTKDKETYLK